MQHGIFGIDRSGTLSSRELSGSLCSVSSQGVTGHHGQCQQQQRLKRIPRASAVQLQLSAIQTGRHWYHQRSACKALCSPATVSGASSAPDEAAGQAQSPVAPTALSNAALRVIFGVLLGCLGAFVIYAGGLLFTGVVCLVTYQASQEFYGFVTSKGISEGMQPPPPLVSALISLLCMSLTFFTYLSNGKATAALAVASFAVLSLQLFSVDQPRFAQLASSVFGLFYCGYLPSFWVKLRLLAVPALGSGHLARGLPAAMSGLTHWTVGLVATLMAVCCVIAADVGAYLCGKSLGRTKLSAISPKKTVEGALGGLLCSIATALSFWRLFQWPANPAVAAALGLLVFFASLFGDLIESVMKRDAGLKDASDLIPGHGGLLDRFDSYIFTGAIVYFQLKFVVPMFGL